MSPYSVGQPFQGAYLEISKNPKYKKLKDAVDEKIIIAEVVNKINRANGKVKMIMHHGRKHWHVIKVLRTEVSCESILRCPPPLFLFF